MLTRPRWDQTADEVATDGRVCLNLARTLNTNVDTACLVHDKTGQ